MLRSSISLALLCLCGCNESVPTSVLLTLDGYFPPSAQLLLSVFDPEGVVMKDRRIPSDSTQAVELPTDLVLLPGTDRGPLRVQGKVNLEGAMVGEGAVEVALEPGHQVSATLTLVEGQLPDRDKDGVPDSIDGCPDLANPAQGACVVQDARADQALDSGPPPDGKSDFPPDAPRPDVSPDVMASDLPLPPDLKPIPDLKVYKPVTSAALSQLFGKKTVDCVMADGTKDGTTIPIVDTATAKFVDGSMILAGAPTATKSWVGTKSAVTIVWDPNACDAEDPLFPQHPEWVSAGLLIRGASLVGGNLVLEPQVTVADINMLDVWPDGKFEAEVFEADDSKLSQYPQVVLPVTAAKNAVLEAAAP